MPRGLLVVVALTVCILLAVSLASVLFWRAAPSSSSSSSEFPRLSCGSRVDLVYTWVNGSDPVHLARVREYRRREGLPAEEESAASSSGRFRDYDVLRYSMRAANELLGPLGRIFLVVADDEALPAWLETKSARVVVVRHSHIMPATALPTFNSNAIESNLHLIPGLSQCFAYLNDDMLYGERQETMRYFWDEEAGVQRVHLGVWEAPMTDRMEDNSWHLSVARSNQRLDALYGTTQRRRYPIHGCYFFHRTIFARMRQRLDASFQKTLHRRFRSADDDVVSFLYSHVALHEFGAREVPFQLHYVALSGDPEANIASLRFLVRRRPLCSCLNDDLGHGSHPATSVAELRQALELLHPRAVEWEKSPALTLAPFDASRFTAAPLGELLLKLFTAGPVVVAAVATIVSFFARKGRL